PEDRPDASRSILVQTKADLDPPPRACDIAVSSVTGAGLAELVSLLSERAARLLPVEGETAINTRHRAALAEAMGWLGEAEATDDLLIVAESLRQARVALDRITGRAGVEDMLDALFGRFCIGK